MWPYVFGLKVKNNFRLWRNEVAHKKAERLKMLKKMGSAALEDSEEEELGNFNKTKFGIAALEDSEAEE